VDAYCGQTRALALIAELEELGIGEWTQRGELPPRRSRWFHDNRAFADWQKGRPFNVVRWERDQWPIRNRMLRPDFVVVPDIVADGEASLAWSAMWRPFRPRAARWPVACSLATRTTCAPLVTAPCQHTKSVGRSRAR
jgi:hypothetical protein